MHSSQPRASEQCGEYEVSDGWASKQISSESDSSDCSHQDRNVALATFFADCKWAVNHFRWSTWLWNPFSNPLQVQMTQPLGEDENYIPVHRRDTHQSSIFWAGTVLWNSQYWLFLKLENPLPSVDGFHELPCQTSALNFLLTPVLTSPSSGSVNTSLLGSTWSLVRLQSRRKFQLKFGNLLQKTGLTSWWTSIAHG